MQPYGQTIRLQLNLKQLVHKQSLTRGKGTVTIEERATDGIFSEGKYHQIGIQLAFQETFFPNMKLIVWENLWNEFESAPLPSGDQSDAVRGVAESGRRIRNARSEG